TRRSNPGATVQARHLPGARPLEIHTRAALRPASEQKPTQEPQRFRNRAALGCVAPLEDRAVCVLRAYAVGDRDVHRAGWLAFHRLATGDAGDAEANVRAEALARGRGHCLRGRT